MSNIYNNKFKVNEREFIKNYFMSSVGIGGRKGLDSGEAGFSLRHYLVDKAPVIQLVSAKLFKDHELPLFGYWVAQGESCLIDVKPNIRKYVFTPDFSGCSLLVDQINEKSYRVYHVQARKGCLEKEYGTKLDSHGLGLAGAMTSNDYQIEKNHRGFAFMMYDKDRWWICYQCQNDIGFSISKEGKVFSQGIPKILGGAIEPVANLTKENSLLKVVRHNKVCLPILRKLDLQKTTLLFKNSW